MYRTPVVLTDTNAFDLEDILDVCKDALMDDDRVHEIEKFLADVAFAKFEHDAGLAWGSLYDAVMSVIYDWFEVE